MGEAQNEPAPGDITRLFVHSLQRHDHGEYFATHIPLLHKLTNDKPQNPALVSHHKPIGVLARIRQAKQLIWK